MTRDVSARLRYQGKQYAKPSLIHSLFLPALQGPGTKVCSMQFYTPCLTEDID